MPDARFFESEVPGSGKLSFMPVETLKNLFFVASFLFFLIFLIIIINAESLSCSVM